MTASEMLLVINDIHNLTLRTRFGGSLKAILLEIEQIAEDAIEQACNDGADDTNFVVVDENHAE